VKILISSNGPNASTGYGVQTALLAERLCRQGHTVAVACNFGQQTGVSSWQTPSGHHVRLYFAGYTSASDDILIAHALHFFEGDPHGGWILALNDMWAVDPERARDLAEFNVAAWAPVDHLVCPPGVARFFHLSKALPMAMSKHAEAEFKRLGLDSTYVPLAVDTKVFKPSFTLEVGGTTYESREFHKIPKQAFVVGMVAMNKGWVFDRKGFSEAFYAFALFRHAHPNALLYLHSEPIGADGLHLKILARAAGIPDDAIIWSNHYAYRNGFTPAMMASLYTSFDVLLAPSHGEGFCVPMIEAQACGVPVVASHATAQTELVGAGWFVDGQPVWDQSQMCPAFMPSIPSILEALEEAYNADLVELQAKAIEFAGQYDADRVFDQFWSPFLQTLAPPEPPAEKAPMTDVAVVVPVMQRPQNVAPLVRSFELTNDGTAALYFVCDADDAEEIDAVKAAGYEPLVSDRGRTFAQKANVGYQQTTESWVFVCGDDVEFTHGWLDEARKLTDRYDVVGTNDSEIGRIRNPEVARGKHADHWLTRRSYIDEIGASLEGPGIFCPEAYFHWWVDREVVGLARARGVYGHAAESRVIHHHPGFDGAEAAREADPAYAKAAEWAPRDRVTFMQRVGLIEAQRVSRAA
jgi:glycosyltransferase involved in cell wall biosynthesis